MELAQFKGFVNNLQDIPLDFVYMMGWHIVIDVDNDLIFSAYHAGNTIGKALPKEYDVTEYLKRHVFPDPDDWKSQLLNSLDLSHLTSINFIYTFHKNHGVDW